MDAGNDWWKNAVAGAQGDGTGGAPAGHPGGVQDDLQAVGSPVRVPDTGSGSAMPWATHAEMPPPGMAPPPAAAPLMAPPPTAFPQPVPQAAWAPPRVPQQGQVEHHATAPHTTAPHTAAGGTVTPPPAETPDAVTPGAATGEGGGSPHRTVTIALTAAGVLLLVVATAVWRSGADAADAADKADEELQKLEETMASSELYGEEHLELIEDIEDTVRGLERSGDRALVRIGAAERAWNAFADKIAEDNLLAAVNIWEDTLPEILADTAEESVRSAQEGEKLATMRTELELFLSAVSTPPGSGVVPAPDGSEDPDHAHGGGGWR